MQRFNLTRKLHFSFISLVFSSGLIFGAAFCYFFRFSISFSPLWLFVLVALLVLNLTQLRLPFFICAFLAGLIFAAFRISPNVSSQHYIDQLHGKSVEVSGQVYEDPTTDGHQSSFYLNNIKINGVELPGVNLYVSASSSASIARSQKLLLSAKLSPAFGAFAASIYRPKILEIRTPTNPEPALLIRNFFTFHIKKYIPEPQVDLSLGYLMGQKKALPKALSEALRIVGLTHIIVASGYNLLILVRLSRRLFSKFSRFALLFFSILLISLFVSIVGFSPSMLRAGVVSISSLIAWYFGRKFHPLKLILLVAAATLFINPLYIIDIGWLLSFASFFGVMLVSPLCVKYFYGDRPANFLVRTLIETASAQLCCLPLLIYFFGNLSVVSLFANLLVLPTIAIVMLLTFFVATLFFLPLLAALFAFAATQLLNYHLFVINYASNLPWALVPVQRANPLIFLTYLALIVFIVYLVRTTKYRFKSSDMIE